MSSKARPSLALVAGLALLGCARPTFMPGDDCELNTQCDAPLTCRLGRCRVECRSPRDCAVGLACVRDEDGLGACQLPSETQCSLSSDCPDFLVCRFGMCTNACDEDRDCPAGARCLEEEGGARGCHDMSRTECRLNTDCPAPYVCAVDLRCREECRKDRDCRDGQICDLAQEVPICAPRDAGVGPVDAGPPDAGPLDAGPLDAGPPDAGPPIVSPPPAPLLAAGLEHTCAAPSSNDLRCWGANDVGQLGNGTTAPVVGTYRLSGLADVTLVAAGARHACAIASDAVSCWGDNSDGQIGVDEATDTRAPVAVTLPATPTDLSCGGLHTCAIAGGTLYCWGNNATGQIGVGDATGTDRFAPTEVTGLGGTPVEVSAFGDHTCVRLSNGTLACFGYNGFGQLGVDSTTTPRTFSPIAVPGLDGVAQISVGTTHTCALRGDGTVWCWGLDTTGQLGDGTGGGQRHTPMMASLADPVLELGLGSAHSCARTASATLCWGQGLYGKLGYVAGPVEATPTAVSGLGGALSVRAGTDHTCVWMGGTDLRCFGRNMDGQVSGTPGDPADGPTPTAVPWAP